MARVKTGWRLATYTDDFGNDYNDLSFKFGNDVPDALLQGLGLTQGTLLPCSGSVPFQPRYLQVTFDGGSVHRFPVATRDRIEAAVTVLRNFNQSGFRTVCINLEGEKWNLITSRAFPATTPSFRSNPYTNIQDRGLKENVRFEYDSDVLGNLIQLSVQVEVAPNDLNTCQKSCLQNPQTAIGICGGSGLGISPRKFTIQALGSNGGITSRVIRQVKVSNSQSQDIRGCITNIAPCAYCLSYKGESIRNLHNLI